MLNEERFAVVYDRGVVARLLGFDFACERWEMKESLMLKVE